MYPAVLSLCMCSALGVVPDRRSPDEPPLDVEATWYDQLRREGRLTVNLKEGHIVFVPTGIVDRKLLDVTFTRYDHKNEAISVFRAKEAELRIDATKRLLLVPVENVYATSIDGSVAFQGRATLRIDLPRTR